MPRPIKCRRVANLPNVKYFKPAGIPLRELDDVQLSVEEVEAIRLKDIEGLDQEAGASKMNVSRPTFQRVLTSARHKMADALLNGKAIRIEGGSFELAYSHFECRQGHRWEVPFETMITAPPRICPTCNTSRIERISTTDTARQGMSQGRGRHRGR